MILNQLEGLVIKNYGGFYYVQDNNTNIFECKIRGKLKVKILSGDRVIFTAREVGVGILEKVLPRDNQLLRPRVANVTRVLIVMAYDQPKPDPVLLDRLLFLAEFNRIIPQIILNKCDLEINDYVKRIIEYYQGKYTVIKTSTKKAIGIDILSDTIAGEIAVFAGPSGTGKSSMLKLLTGALNVPTQEVSSKIGRGKHTTRHVELYPLPHGGWIVDTPGFSVLDMPEMKREDFTRCFPDFEIWAETCKFDNCLHYREKDCGIKRAVQDEQILASRYNNYVTMLEEVIERERSY